MTIRCSGRSDGVAVGTLVTTNPGAYWRIAAAVDVGATEFDVTLEPVDAHDPALYGTKPAQWTGGYVVSD